MSWRDERTAKFNQLFLMRDVIMIIVIITSHHFLGRCSTRSQQRPEAREKGGSSGTCPLLWLRWGNALQLWSGLNVAYTTKALMNLSTSRLLYRRQNHQIRFVSGLCPDPDRCLQFQDYAHGSCIAISWPMDIWLPKLIIVFYFIMLTCSPSFTLAALHHLLCSIRCSPS